jgi:uroporphyrinogen decarboxylase
VNRVLPLQNPKPDCERFIRTIMGQVKPDRPPLIEYIVDEVHRQAITTDLLGREWVEYQWSDKASQNAYWDNFIEFWYRLGYDFVRLEISLSFNRNVVVGEDQTRLDQERGWADEHKGTIETWDDFERYEWPTVEDADISVLEYIATHLPDGMGFITNHAGGIFETVTQMMSYEKFCMALYDEPDLVKAMCEKIGTLMEGYYKRLAHLQNVIAFFPGDDMGFRSGTLASPDVLRTLFLPWHQRFAKIAHDKGIPYFLHSCGQLGNIYDHLIDVVGIDAKHSFEDAITPAPDFQKQYGDRIGTLGGLDINILAGGSRDDVEKRALELLSVCGARGRYALGSGNSVPSYVPLENYLTMVNAALA